MKHRILSIILALTVASTTLAVPYAGAADDLSDAVRDEFSQTEPWDWNGTVIPYYLNASPEESVTPQENGASYSVNAGNLPSEGSQKGILGVIHSSADCGPSNSKDLSDYADSANFIYGIKADESVNIDGLYLGIANTMITEDSYDGAESLNWVGVPLADYYTSDDMGTYKKIAVPVESFKLSNEKAINIQSFLGKFSEEYDKEINLKYFSGMGFIRISDDGIAAEEPGEIFCDTMQVVSVGEVTYLSAAANGSGVDLTWTMSETGANTFEIIFNGSVKETVSVEDIVFEDGTYKYTVSDAALEEGEYQIRAMASADGFTVYSSESSPVIYGNPESKILVKDFDVAGNIMSDGYVRMWIGCSPSRNTQRVNGTHIYKVPMVRSNTNYNWTGLGLFSRDKVTGGAKDTQDEDLSAYEENGYAVFGIEVSEGVNLDDYQLAIMSAANSSINSNAHQLWSKLPLADYYTESEKETYKEIAIPISTFVENANKNGVDIGRSENNPDADKYIKDKTFYTSKFAGMGISCSDITGRTDTASDYETITVHKYQIVKADPVEISLENDGTENILSFTEPAAAEYIDGFELKTTSSDGTASEQSISPEKSSGGVYTLRMPADNSKYSVRVVYNNGYEMKSPWSNEVTFGEFSEPGNDESGGEADDEGKTTTLMDFDMTYNWGAGTPVAIPARFNGTPKESTGTYPQVGISGVFKRWDIGYGYVYDFETAVQNSINQQWPWCARGYTYNLANGGENGRDSASYNLAPYIENGNFVLGIYAEENFDLNNLYISFCQNYAGGTDKDAKALFGVPVTDYYTDADKGTHKYVSIPLSVFENDCAFKSYYVLRWHNITGEPDTVDFTHFNGIMLIRDESNGQGTSEGYIYCTKMAVNVVSPVSGLKVINSSDKKITIGWNPSESEVDGYNIYRNGELIDSVSSDTASYEDIMAGEEFVTGESYTYSVCARDSFGAVSKTEETQITLGLVGKPENFKAVPKYGSTADLSVNLSWEPALYGEAAEYIIYRNNSVYKTFTGGETAFTDYNISAGNVYEYYMQVKDTAGNLSNETQRISVTAQSVSAPSGIKCHADGKDIKVSWNSADYAEKYEIYVNDELADTVFEPEYTYYNASYNKAYKFKVKSVNAAGAKSVSAESKLIYIENPSYIVNEKIFEDGFDNEKYEIEKSTAISDDISGGQYISGSKALKIDFSAPSVSDYYLRITPKENMDVKAYADNSAMLCFWINADDEVNVNSLRVALMQKATTKGKSYDFRSSLAVKDYLNGTGEWQFVKIPFADFSPLGEAIIGQSKFTIDLDMSKINSVDFLFGNMLSYPAALYIDEIYAAQYTGYEITDIFDQNGNKLIARVSADNKKFTLKFDCDMNPESLNNSTVKITDPAGGILKTYGVYNAEEMSYDIILLENMKKYTQYTISTEGALRVQSTVPSDAVITVITNGAALTDNTENLPQIAISSEQQSGNSKTAVTLKFADGISVLSANAAELKISYDKNVLSVSEDSVKTLGAFSGAEVSVEDGVITINHRGDLRILKGSFAEITFSVKTSADAQLLLSGSFELDNIGASSLTDAITIDLQGEIGSSSSSKPSSGSTPASASRGSSSAGIIQAAPVQTVSAALKDAAAVPWAEESINKLYNAKLISGYTDGTFRPNNRITREEFVKMIISICNVSLEDIDCNFSDVSKDDWFYPYVANALRLGIIKGVSETEFGTGSYISREDMCVILDRTFNALVLSMKYQYDAMEFADEPDISDYAKSAVTNLTRYGMVNGVGDDKFAPKDSLTRAMAAKVLASVYDLIK